VTKDQTGDITIREENLRSIVKKTETSATTSKDLEHVLSKFNTLKELPNLELD
jgi:hypothetical protein